MSSKLNIPIPKFSSEKPYERYKAEIEAWAEATDTEKKKHGILVALSLPEDDVSQIRDKVFNEIELANLKLDDGLKKLLEYLDGQFAKDDLTETYERYIEFERCKRDKNQKINDFILEYEKKHNALKKKNAKYPEIILAMKLIDNSNLTCVDRKLVLSGMDYTKADELFKQSKESLRKFIGEQSKPSEASYSSPAPAAIKLEAFIAENEQALVAAGWQKRSYDSLRGRGRSNSLPSANSRGNSRGRSPFRRSNPTGRDGHVLQCFECNSTQHMLADCPERNIQNQRNTDIHMRWGCSQEMTKRNWCYCYMKLGILLSWTQHAAVMCVETNGSMILLRNCILKNG